MGRVRQGIRIRRANHSRGKKRYIAKHTNYTYRRKTPNGTKKYVYKYSRISNRSRQRRYKYNYRGG